jgi:hypothetical protein
MRFLPIAVSAMGRWPEGPEGSWFMTLISDPTVAVRRRHLPIADSEMGRRRKLE